MAFFIIASLKKKKKEKVFAVNLESVHCVLLEENLGIYLALFKLLKWRKMINSSGDKIIES